MNSTTTSREVASGRFVLRVPPGLHDALRRAASDAGMSLNHYCVRKLGSFAAPVGGPGEDVVMRAAEQFGGGLVGVLAFGSWARGDMTEASDIDMMIVVDPEVRIVRSLYRGWDDRPLAWEGRAIQVHIVHAPEEDEEPTGLWGEAALEGLVLFERDLELSRRLVAIRRRITEGAMARRETHGHPYWVMEG